LALLVRFQWVAGRRAAAVISAGPLAAVIALTHRIQWFDKREATNISQHHHAWIVFDHAHPPGRPPSSRQFNRKADEGSKHPDRNAQFEYINPKVIAAQAQHQPVISVDTKKRELIGNFRNGGTDYRPRGTPQRVNVHDFEDKELGKVVPYGVYDMTANAGFVSVGITSDTAEFAVQSIRCWLDRMGRQRYPDARELTVTADCGGSNGARVRLWKVELQKLAD
jgi:hypothetical protein